MVSEFGSRRCLAFDPCYEPNAFDCGATTWFKNVSWFNSPRRMTFDWEHEAAVLDLDGTFLEGEPNTYVIAHSEAFDKSLCSTANSKYTIDGFPAQTCDSANAGSTFKPHRSGSDQENKEAN